MIRQLERSHHPHLGKPSNEVVNELTKITVAPPRSIPCSIAKCHIGHSTIKPPSKRPRSAIAQENLDGRLQSRVYVAHGGAAISGTLASEMPQTRRSPLTQIWQTFTPIGILTSTRLDNNHIISFHCEYVKSERFFTNCNAYYSAGQLTDMSSLRVLGLWTLLSVYFLPFKTTASLSV